MLFCKLVRQVPPPRRSKKVMINEKDILIVSK